MNKLLIELPINSLVPILLGVVLFSMLLLKTRYWTKLAELRKLNGGYYFYENPKYADQLNTLNKIRYSLMIAVVLFLIVMIARSGNVSLIELILVCIIGVAELIVEILRLDLLLKGIK